jgi:hypothetical protein
VCECLLRSDFNELWLVRLLMSIRSGKLLVLRVRSMQISNHEGLALAASLLRRIGGASSRIENETPKTLNDSVPRKLLRSDGSPGRD